MNTSSRITVLTLATTVVLVAACGTVEPDALTSQPTPSAEQSTTFPAPIADAGSFTTFADASFPMPTEAASTDLDGDVVLSRASGPFVGVLTDDDEQVWKTDFSKRTVPPEEIQQVGRTRDSIPTIDSPKFIATNDADEWLGDREPVIVLEVGSEARAYPIQIMIWHEIVNDTVGGVPVVVTFCPLCNSAVTFDRGLDDVVYDFGVSGFLRNSDLIMCDRQTETWWQQLTGEAIVGQLAGQHLTLRLSSILSYADFKAAHPSGTVLSRETGFDRPYGDNPYVGYDDADSPPHLFQGDPDGRLMPKERVVAINVSDRTLAVPFSVLEQKRVVEYRLVEQDIVVFYKPGTQSALDAESISQSRDVGATGVFSSVLDGQILTFGLSEDRFTDGETGSTWNISGQAIDGLMLGRSLTPIPHGNHFWFAWAAFYPETEVYAGR